VSAPLEKTRIMPQGHLNQIRVVFENIRTVLLEAGGDIADIPGELAAA
jgi:enamine deaminase RidA (YjgF/YER057c/UK114 family)